MRSPLRAAQRPQTPCLRCTGISTNNTASCISAPTDGPRCRPAASQRRSPPGRLERRGAADRWCGCASPPPPVERAPHRTGTRPAAAVFRAPTEQITGVARLLKVRGLHGLPLFVNGARPCPQTTADHPGSVGRCDASPAGSVAWRSRSSPQQAPSSRTSLTRRYRQLSATLYRLAPAAANG